MLRTRLGKMLVTVSLVLVPAIGVAAPAVAASAAGVSHQVTSASETSSVITPLASWHYAGRYSNQRACQEQGRQEVDGGYADDYKCVKVGSTAKYDLYLWY